MAEPTILAFNYSDDQLELVRKLNFNFEQISSAGGGVQGPIGPTGATGMIGQIGPIGPTGNTGPRGSRWFVGGTEAPTGGYGAITVEGDYWIDTDAIEKTLYVFGPSGWQDTGYDLIPEDEFKLIPNLITATGATSNYLAIVQNTLLPSSNTFVLSDGNPSIDLTNPDYTNFLITTDPQVNEYPIMEFSRGDATITGPSGYFRRPVWRWTGGNSDYNISFAVPSDRLTILTKAGITASVSNKVNMQADDSLLLTSKSTIDIVSGGPSFFNTTASLGVTSGNFSLNSSRLESSLDLKIQTIPGKSPSNDPVFNNYSMWIDNPSGTSLFIGSTGPATGGNHLLVAKKDQVNLLEVRTDGVLYSKKRNSYNRYPVFNTSNSISVNYSGVTISWYYITASTLQYNNTFLLDVNPANNIGVAVNIRSGDPDNVMNLLEKYQTMKINVLTNSNDPLKKIKYLGYFTGSPPTISQFITFNDRTNQAEIELMRGEGIDSSTSRILYSSPFGSGRLI